ncbi:glycosyl transferase family 90 [Halomonas shengliensis]|nr:glycosyl transferase family 90 [Halomonas shengliensis]
MKNGKNAYRAHKLKFYITGLLGALVPRIFFRRQVKSLLSEFSTLPAAEQKAIMARVKYYNKLDKLTELSSEAVSNKNFKIRTTKSTYHLDFYQVARYFQESSTYHYRFGDKTFVPDEPTFVKSRPIRGNNQNSVLLKLDSVRHFYTVNDPYHYKNKKDILVWRGAAHQPHRQHFLAKCHGMDLCDVGATDNKAETARYRKPFMSIEQQLGNKFIFSIEGNDVATNLKWIMASNSLCFMKQPIYETWFMEGTLIPGHHYVEVSDDFSDLGQKIEYYIAHPEEAQEIIRNANRYIANFYNSQRETLIALIVFDRYLSYTQKSL